MSIFRAKLKPALEPSVFMSRFFVFTAALGFVDVDQIVTLAFDT